MSGYKRQAETALAVPPTRHTALGAVIEAEQAWRCPG